MCLSPNLSRVTQSDADDEDTSIQEKQIYFTIKIFRPNEIGTEMSAIDITIKIF